MLRSGLTRLRYGGLAASTVLAAGAYGAGALPAGDPAPGLRTAGLAAVTGPFLLGVLGWLAGTVGLAVVWWRLGTMIRTPRPGAVRLRWLLVTGALWAAPLVFAAPLGARDVYSYACQGALYTDGLDPYQVGAVGGGCPWQHAVADLWRDTPAPYGPLAVALSAAAVRLSRGLATAPDGQLLLAVGALRLLSLLGGVLIAVSGIRLARACGVDPVAAAWLGLLSPLVAVHALAGVHHDALLAGLVVSALAAATTNGTAPARQDPAGQAGAHRPRAGPDAGRPGVRAMVAGVAGGTVGLAIAVKITAVVAVPFVALLVTPHTRPVRHRWWPAAVVVAAAAGAFAAVTGLTGLGVGWLGALADTGALVQWTSIPTGVGMAAGYLLRAVGAPAAVDPAVTVARLAGLAGLALVLAALCVRAWRAGGARRAVVLRCGYGFGALAVLSPVFYSWYAVLPLAVLAASTVDERARRRLAAVAIVLSLIVLPNGLGLAVLTKLPGALLDVLLVAGGAGVWLRRRNKISRPDRERSMNTA